MWLSAKKPVFAVGETFYFQYCHRKAVQDLLHRAPFVDGQRPCQHRSHPRLTEQELVMRDLGVQASIREKDRLRVEASADPSADKVDRIMKVVLPGHVDRMHRKEGSRSLRPAFPQRRPRSLLTSLETHGSCQGHLRPRFALTRCG